jgi:hypothetical protein
LILTIYSETNPRKKICNPETKNNPQIKLPVSKIAPHPLFITVRKTAAKPTKKDKKLTKSPIRIKRRGNRVEVEINAFIAISK